MKRMIVVAATALLLAACSKAPEDVTAHYSLAGRADALQVKAAANGDARIDLMGNTLIRRGGTEYLVGKDGQGEFAAKIDDFAAAAAEVMKSKGMVPKALPEQPDYELAKQGSEDIAGLKGDVWKVQLKPGAKAPATPPPGDIDAVVNEDGEYKHLGKALAMQTHLDSATMRQVTGKVGSLEQRVEEMLSKGLVLRFGTALKLDKVEKTPLKPADFELPKTVLDKEGLRKRFEAMVAAQPAAGPAGPQGEAPAGAPAPAAPVPQAPAPKAPAPARP